MQPANPQLPKTPAEKGRELLRAKGFQRQDGAGNRGELWVHRDGAPAFVAYVGEPEYFLTESLENALAQVP